MPRHSLASAGAVLAATLCVLATATLAAAKPSHGGAPSGYDISFPQCGRAYPTLASFGIVGVNDGIVYSANPCTASELYWAEAAQNHAPAFYANTGDPGPGYSSHWPTGQLSPEGCDGSNSASCSYDYGWNAAQNSFASAVAAEQADGSASSATTAAAAPWWLDVETGNSWETLESAYGANVTSDVNDQADLQGAVAYFTSQGVGTVGFYSTGFQWASITGGTGSAFAASPGWVPGYRTLNAAQAACGSTSFTGGRVAMTQYPSAGFDGDYACP